MPVIPIGNLAELDEGRRFNLAVQFLDSLEAGRFVEAVRTALRKGGDDGLRAELHLQIEDPIESWEEA
jgi:hypothetical protein